MYTIKSSANFKDLPDAKTIRQAVFVEEQGFVVEFDDIDDKAHHVVIYDGESPIATGRTYQDGDTYIIGRVAVVKAFRGNQIGKLVMEELEKIIIALGVKKIALSAQVQAKGFYENLGYKPEGEEYLDEHCPHIKMIKSLK